MYLGLFHIDDYVGIPAATHRFSTGAAYAPTSLTYSIYEEAGTTGIDEDVDMVVASPFDTITGCYWVRRQLTAAAGFEAGKNYLVVIKATVDSVSAIQMHTFQVEASIPTTAEIADKILGRSIQGGADGSRTVTSALRKLRNKWALSGTTLTVYQEDDATADHTETVSTDAAANPVVSSDPV